MVAVRHFAELENNIVKRILCISEVECLDNLGNFHEVLGAAFCIKLTGSSNRWIECSTDGSIRKNPCDVNFVYDEGKDGFYYPNSPYPSFVLNDKLRWEPPIKKPDDIEGFWWNWDEQTLSWIKEIITP